VIATGTPEQVAATPKSYTGEFLADLVEPEVKVRRARKGETKKKKKKKAPVAA
jgi:excinuclease ABC subunit A